MRPWLPLILLAAGVLSCSPAKPTRIGPAVVPRPADCELEVLDEGARPTRPYREVGMVTLENCQDYRAMPCNGWLREAACGLGGTVVYPSDDGLVRADPATYQAEGEGTMPVARPMTVKIMVAAYVADLISERDPMMESRTCSPPCGEGRRCVNNECVDAGEPCDEPEEAPDEAAPQRCTE